MLEGQAARAEFALDPDRIHLNHGAFGAVPRSVRAAQDRWRDEWERDPTAFFVDVMPKALRRAAGDVAQRFGGAAEDWVFAENATQAIGGILASLALEPGDAILTTSHAYGAVAKAMRRWASRRGAEFHAAELPTFLSGDDEVIAAVAAAFTPRTRLLVIDHIVSRLACIFPVAEIVRKARERGIAVLVDGAHAPGQIPLDVPSLGADWYTGNAHKWFFAPRGCGLLWTAPHRQAETRPAVLSWGSDEGYTQAFDWIGTRDVSPWLAFETAAAAHDRFGGPALMARNRALAADAAEMLGFPATAPAAMRAAMAALALPACPMAPEILQARLSREFALSVPAYALQDRVFVRISAQTYNVPADYESLARALKALGASA